MRRGIFGLIMAAAIVAASAAMLHRGIYGLTLFLMVPVAIGAIGAWFAKPASAPGAAGAGMLCNIAAGSLLLLLGVEGAICIAMSLPLTVPLGALGGWLCYEMEPRRMGAGGAAMMLLLPGGTLGFDVAAHAPVFEVRTAIEIASPPETVWRRVVTFADLPEPAAWYFRAGLAYPKRARIVGSGVGAVRYCEFSTGPFVEPIEVWNAPRLLRFRVTENPAPMHEWSPYARVLPRHLHGYLVSERGQFLLTPLANGGTRLEGATWYRHGLWPAQYWRLWSDAIIHRIHLRVLEHIRDLAERG